MLEMVKLDAYLEDTAFKTTSNFFIWAGTTFDFFVFG